ncbi:response regulator [Flavobacterium sp. DGU38]|uniref:Response regulator n=1 Tax=Flavobacterium calami TaxID=3139144 RepID=A0ABU9IP38_9FLAO
MSLAKQNSQRYIFHADDDEDDRELFVDVIREIDPSVILVQAGDGLQLMEILNTINDPIPEILFLDINMPGKGGFECLEEIRRQEGRVKELNIIILSTSNDPKDIEKSLELGANFYAVKPSQYDALRCFVKDVLDIDWEMTENIKNFRLI